MPEAEPDLAQLSWPVRTRLERILARIDEYAPSLLGPEGAIVARRLAVRAVSARPTVLSTPDRDQANVGAIIHAAGKGMIWWARASGCWPRTSRPSVG